MQALHAILGFVLLVAGRPLYWAFVGSPASWSAVCFKSLPAALRKGEDST